MERDEILKLDDAALSRIVKLEFARGSGNGGQKRNKMLLKPTLTSI